MFGQEKMNRERGAWLMRFALVYTEGRGQFTSADYFGEDRNGEDVYRVVGVLHGLDASIFVWAADREYESADDAGSAARRRNGLKDGKVFKERLAILDLGL